MLMKKNPAVQQTFTKVSLVVFSHTITFFKAKSIPTCVSLEKKPA